MIDDRYSQLRRLIAVLKSIGLAKDYRLVREQADWLSYYASSNEPSPLERQEGVVAILEKLPSFLEELRDRARRPDKKKRYDSIISTVKFGFPELLDMWRYWDKSKEEVYSMLNNLLDSARQVRYWTITKDDNLRPVLIFAEISNAVDENTPDGRFHLKVLKLLPKPRIEPEDYQELIVELEQCIEEWPLLTMTEHNKEQLEKILSQLDEYITQLHVSSLMEL